MSAVANGTSFGTPTRLENELGGLILDHHPFAERIRFVSSGTEAAMSAIRLARGVTGKSKILKFDGCYHGHVDALCWSRRAAALPRWGHPHLQACPRLMPGRRSVLPLNDLEALEATMKQYADDLAVVAIEPIPANNGLLIQDPGLLARGAGPCATSTGCCSCLMRSSAAFGWPLGVRPSTMGSSPMSWRLARSSEAACRLARTRRLQRIMDHVAPVGPVYQAGTLSGNPVAMAAGAGQLTECLKPGFYEDQERRTRRLVDPILAHAERKGQPLRIFTRGSIFWLAFSEQVHIRRSSEIDPDSMAYFSKLHAALLDRGVYLGPSGYEVGFVSAAHTDAVIDASVSAFTEALDVTFS